MVPVSSAEEGLDIVERLRFDMVICAVRLPGLNWVTFCERVRLRVGRLAPHRADFRSALSAWESVLRDGGRYAAFRLLVGRGAEPDGKLLRLPFDLRAAAVWKNAWGAAVGGGERRRRWWW